MACLMAAVVELVVFLLLYALMFSTGRRRVSERRRASLPIKLNAGFADEATHMAGVYQREVSVLRQR